jgi:NADH-quinone oxidoreductase subunit M
VTSQLLNLVVWSPVLVAALVVFLPRGEAGQIRVATLLGMLVNFVLCAAAFGAFEPGGAEFQLEYRIRWIDEIGVSYHLGMDGLAATLVLLTGLLGPLVVLGSWTYINDRVKEFHLALLVLQTAMLGALVSLDVLLFYIFFEAMLVPMYLLIGVWGSEERQMAATKFFLYTLVGSLLMLVALLAVYFIAQPAGARSFDYASIYNGLLIGQREAAACITAGTGVCNGASVQGTALFHYGPWLFAAFAVAFAIKVPMWPLHTWLPDAHVQAPAAGSIILAGVMLKMGTFGFWRFAIPLFPVAARQHATLLAGLAVIGIVYGALMCLAQRDIKKLIAYSSVSHLGYCMLGMVAMTPEGATGSAYQMLNHGVSTGALFLMFGMLYERRHARLMSDYGGLSRSMPVFAALFLIITFSSVAVPGTNGFVGEFLVLLGTFKSELPWWAGVLAASGVILGAAYMLWMVQRVFFGPITRPENASLSDMSRRELAVTLPFVVLVVVMGLKPQPLLDVIAPSTDRFIARAWYARAPDAVPDATVQVTVRPLPPRGGAPLEVAPAQPPTAVELRPDVAPMAARVQRLAPGVLVPSARPLPFAVPPAPVDPGQGN